MGTKHELTLSRLKAGKSYTVEDIQEIEALAQLGARVLEILLEDGQLANDYPRGGTELQACNAFFAVRDAARSLGLLDSTAERDAKAKGPNPTAPTPAPGERCPRCHRRKGTGHLPGCLLDRKEGA